MEEKQWEWRRQEQQDEVEGYPLAPHTFVPRSDQVSAPPVPLPNLASGEGQGQEEGKVKNYKRKRIQCMAIIIAFILVQSIILLLLLLFITRVTTPGVDMGEAIVTRGGDSLRLTARLHIRNSNFGQYHFEATSLTIRIITSHSHSHASHFQIPDSQVKSRSTKKISVTADLGWESEWESDDGGLQEMEFRVKGELRGKVEVVNVIKRKKTAEVDCRIRLTKTNTFSTYHIRDFTCH